MSTTGKNNRATGPKNQSRSKQPDPVRLMASIIRMQRTLYRKDIAHWRHAREEALNIQIPRRYLLTELYDDILLDGFIYGQYKNRILRVKNTRFAIMQNGDNKINNDLTIALRKSWVRQLIEWAVEAKFHGYSLVYFTEARKESTKIQLVPRDHVSPERSIILRNPYDVDGFQYTEAPYSNYCLGIGSDTDFGLLDRCAPLYILKKHSWQNWDEFEEIFGIPIRIAKTASRDKAVQAEIQKWLREMGSSPYGLFPADTELQIVENTRTDSFQVFNEKRKAANEELAILINGQFESSTASGSRAKAESVIAKTQDEITKDDIRDIEELMTDRVLPMLRNFGFQIPEGVSFVNIEREKISQTDRATVFSTISGMGYEIDQSQIEEEFGLHITGKKRSEPKEEEEENNLSLQERINKYYFKGSHKHD